MHWITAFGIAFALHAHQRGLQLIYPGDILAMALLCLFLAAMSWSAHQCARQDQAGEEVFLRLGPALKRTVRPMHRRL
jgi:putative effector of murein hydrolase LrgA (UPF0299 family)